MMDKFDPNKTFKKPWATYIPSRQGADFKVHASRAQAMSAITYHGNGIIYRLQDDEWIQVFRVDDTRDLKSDTCAKCLNSTVVSNISSFAGAVPRIEGKVCWNKTDPNKPFLEFRCIYCARSR
jgi:hypothetical protein